ncbi:unnamed protein product [Parascedosporium putredinis]|uniref:Uncharacterized protein n=1 Tax=Parascedosporium putredinis TaxID=1442378 RepID=A0A9P1HBS7_9PEZI|nr:unnamed protein product [Parascedosporium putredinis]CAI8004023.1 unnamed protein product [Parascedosporium putredinis]
MPLCDRCSLLSIDGLVEQDVPFQPDIGTLKASADRGCAFCALCWYTMRTSNKLALVENLLRGESAWPGDDAWTPQIWLRGVSFHQRGQDGAHIAVSCGKLHWGPEAWKQDPDCNRTPTVDGKLEVYDIASKVEPMPWRLR